MEKNLVILFLNVFPLPVLNLAHVLNVSPTSIDSFFPNTQKKNLLVSIKLNTTHNKMDSRLG